MHMWMALIVLSALGIALQNESVSARGMGASPPAGLAPATAPGGTKGIAGPRNVDEALRSGQAYAFQPGVGGIRAYRPEPSVHRREHGPYR